MTTVLLAEVVCALWVTKKREAQETLTGCTVIGITISIVIVIIFLLAFHHVDRGTD